MPTFSDNDFYWMKKAIELAKQAAQCGEVPVGAIVIAQNTLISTAHNLTINKKNACAHAEILALEEAFKAQNNYRLSNATIYITLEPCCMCAGALIHSRVDRIIFGAYDKRVGAAGSVFNVLGDPRQYHQPKVTGGCLQQECEQLLTDFFKQKRKASASTP
jgi:tRNA(adenine34) deaminase